MFERPNVSNRRLLSSTGSAWATSCFDCSFLDLFLIVVGLTHDFRLKQVPLSRVLDGKLHNDLSQDLLKQNRNLRYGFLC